jgi:predicted esterase
MKKIIKIILFLSNIQTTQLFSTQQPTTIFCHGILNTKNQMHQYKNFIQNPKITFDFPDAEKPSGWNFNNFIYQSYTFFRNQGLNREKMYMSYGPDIQALKDQIKSDESYILFGFSRGAATVINYLAKHNPDNIKAIVLNAAPADFIQSIDALDKVIGYNFAPTRATKEKLFNTVFPAYQIGSIPPKDIIPSITNKNLPIFIAHAKTDKIVPISAAWQLYTAFLQAGFTDVYLCELQSGEHKAYPKSPDAINFLQGLHSFYKKYNFDYNPEFAIIDDLTSLQPHIDEITQNLMV